MSGIKLEELQWYFVAQENEWVAVYEQYTLKSFFQPIYTQNINSIYGYESLIRVYLCDGRTISPLDFFACFLDEDELVKVGIVCAWLHIRNFAKLSLNSKVFINIHPNMFACTQTIKNATLQIHNRICEEGLRSEQIIWEITEFKESNVQKFIAGVEEFRQLGHQLAIDDYGQQSSNDERVYLLKPDMVKIDRSLIQEFFATTKATYLPKLLEKFNQNGICTVIEGIETKEEYERIKHLPFSLIQGYFTGKPSSMSCISHANVTDF